MANTEPSKESTKPSPKRRLKPAPTMREQAVKAQANADKPEKGRRLRSVATSGKKPFSKIAKIFDRQPFRFIGKILVPPFIRNSFKELRLVTWPNRRETFRLTSAVIMFAIVFGVIVTAVDYGLDKLFKALILN